MRRIRHRVGAVVLTVALMTALVPHAWASISVEREIGDDFLRQARLQPGYLSDDYELISLVREIGSKLVTTLGAEPFDYEFNVVRDDTMNAFAVPGGKIFVHAGLVARVGSEDELAGLLGHEIAHAHAHHAIRQQQKTAAANYASLLGIFAAALNPVLGQAAIAAGQSVRLKYQRDMEREADYLGVEYASKAGYDPNAMLKLLRIIYEEQKLNPTNVPPYFLSHPLTGERMANLEATLRKLEWDSKPLSPSWRLERAQAIARASSQTRHAAVPDYERRLATATAAERPNALELIGLLMAHGEDYPLAVQYLSEAEKVGRNVDRELGRAYLRRGDLDGARVRLERAAAADPKDWNVLSDLGELAYQEGDYAKAVAKLADSVELDEYRPETQRALGRAYEKAGQIGRGYYHFAIATDLEQRPLQAIDYYKRALESLPEGDPLRAQIDEKIKTAKERAEGGPPRGFRSAALPGTSAAPQPARLLRAGRTRARVR